MTARTARRRAMEARGEPLEKAMVCENMRRCKRARRMALDGVLGTDVVQPQGVAAPERASCPWVLQQALSTKMAEADDGRDARACKAIVAGAICSHQRDQIALQCGHESHRGDWLVWLSVSLSRGFRSWVCCDAPRFCERKMSTLIRYPRGSALSNLIARSVRGRCVSSSGNVLELG